MKVGIIGCGLAGKKRASALGNNELAAVSDIDLQKAELFKKFNPELQIFSNYNHLIGLKDIDIIIVSTTNNLLAEITLKSLLAGKHVLVEKPAARCSGELEKIIKLAIKNKKMVKVGFNHRYHPALIQANEISSSGKLGDLMFIRGRYGHGGRPGYEKEWRAYPKLSGGGELLDQGIHLIDLSRWFLGDFKEIYGELSNYYWDMTVEDNAFLLLKTIKGQVAWLHASCTEWKNMFSFEVYGRNGKLQIDGLGGSYGIERLSYYKMLPEMGPPETTTWEYPGDDKSWKNEFDDFIYAIDKNTKFNGDIYDAYEALKIIDKIYNRKEKI